MGSHSTHYSLLKYLNLETGYYTVYRLILESLLTTLPDLWGKLRSLCYVIVMIPDSESQPYCHWFMVFHR